MTYPDALPLRLLTFERRHRVAQAGYALAREFAALDRALVEEELSLAAAVLEEEDFYDALALDPALSLSRIAHQRWVEFCQLRAAFTPEMLERLTAYAQHKLARHQDGRKRPKP